MTFTLFSLKLVLFDFQLNFWTKMMNSLKVKTRQTGGTTSPFYTWRYLKGIWNEKFGLKKTLLFERIFEITKIGLYSSRVTHFSLEIFGCTALHNDLLGIKYIFEIIPFNHSKVCWFSASAYIHTQMHSFKWLCSTTSVIFLISQNVIMQCDVCGRIVYIYI